LLDAAETVLGYFGFDGSICKSENRGIRSNNKKGKWRYELRREKVRDIEVESTSS
jgi:hypothetical protein